MEFADSKPFIKWTHSFKEEAGFTPVMLLHVEHSCRGKASFKWKQQHGIMVKSKGFGVRLKMFKY